ncbi:MAG: AbrB/MazE/SpoVT family DNA-binding domain-containing protein [Nanoarchaeota archaeon]
MARMIEIGTISSRGQIAIPSSIRTELELTEGEKVIFILEGDTLIVKKVMSPKTWEELTKPIREAVSKTNIKESDIPGIVKRFRKAKKANENSN